MTWDKVLKIVNMVFPAIGVGLMIFYEVCDTSCSYLQGTFVGVDLKYIGILFMAVLLALSLPPAFRYKAPVNHLRTMMLSGALGGEILLVRFQIVHETYCPFCLAFGLCLFVLFAASFTKMNKYLAIVSLLVGIGAFALFFKGAVLPLYAVNFSFEHLQDCYWLGVILTNRGSLNKRWGMRDALQVKPTKGRHVQTLHVL